MANDRIYVKCKGCGGYKMFFKYFPGNLTTRTNFGIIEWLDQHTDCHPKGYDLDLGGDPGFEFICTSDPDSLLKMEDGKCGYYPGIEEGGEIKADAEDNNCYVYVDGKGLVPFKDALIFEMAEALNEFRFLIDNNSPQGEIEDNKIAELIAKANKIEK